MRYLTQANLLGVIIGMISRYFFIFIFCLIFSMAYGQVPNSASGIIGVNYDCFSGLCLGQMKPGASLNNDTVNYASNNWYRVYGVCEDDIVMNTLTAFIFNKKISISNFILAIGATPAIRPAIYEKDAGALVFVQNLLKNVDVSLKGDGWMPFTKDYIVAPGTPNLKVRPYYKKGVFGERSVTFLEEKGSYIVNVASSQPVMLSVCDGLPHIVGMDVQ